MRERTAVTLPVQTREVGSYEDDVYAWTYLDQQDGLIRYEAYVVGYDDFGRPTTLEFVFEEGAYRLEEFPEVHRIWLEAFPGPLSEQDWEQLHKVFEAHEQYLKKVNRLRWTHRLRALGYDVISRAW